MRKILSLTLALLLCLSMVAVAPIVLADNEYTIIDLDNDVYKGGSNKFLFSSWGSINKDGDRTYIQPANALRVLSDNGKFASFRLAKADGTAFAVEAGETYELVCDFFTNSDWGQGRLIFDVIGSDKDAYDFDADETIKYSVPDNGSGKWYDGQVFRFTAPKSGDLRIITIANSSKLDGQYMRFSNMKIRKAPVVTDMTVDPDFSNYTHNFNLYATNYAGYFSVGTDETTGYKYICPGDHLYPTNKQYNSFRPANSEGTAYRVTEGKAYKVVCDLYTNCTSDQGTVYFDSISAHTQVFDTALNQTNAFGIDAVSEATWIEDKEFVFVAQATGDLRITAAARDTKCEKQSIKFANISITELVEVNITVDGYIGDAEVPSKAYQNDTFDKILPKIDHVEWYLDEEYTVPATGAIGVEDVTVYAKVLPYAGITTSGEAGLFIGGKDLSSNAGIDNVSDNSAVYEIDGEKYTAFRVFGTYTAPDNGGVPDFGKVVVAEGDEREIASRHVMLGYKEPPTLEDKYVMSNATTNFDKCWSFEQNLDGTWKVTYSLLLKDIPEDYAATAFIVKSAIVTTDDTTIYSGEMVEGVSAQAIYDGIPGEKPVWFN